MKSDAILAGPAAMNQPGSPIEDITPAFEEILKIDVHAHIFEDMPEFAAMARRANLRLINVCFCGTNPEILESSERQAEHLAREYPSCCHFASTFDLTRRFEPDYAAQVITWFDRTFDAGAVMAKIWKEVGMEVKARDGSYLMPDDPLFDPIYAHLAKRSKPLISHLADPIEAWLPLAPNTFNYHYYKNHPEWHVHGKEGFPSHEAIMAARDNIMVKHPDLILIGAHLGSLTHDLDELARRLDRFPNLYVDVAARTPMLKTKPADQVRAFFMKYQDRILYGTDAERDVPEEPSPREERENYTKRIEQMYRADYLYYSGRGQQTINQRPIESLSLPRAALEKIYHGNARRLIPDLRKK